MNCNKKIAPEAGTPETKGRKILSINSILKKGGEVKVAEIVALLQVGSRETAIAAEIVEIV